MKKIIEIIKKHDNIFVFVYMMLALSVYIFAVKLIVGDELWNFSFLYKFSNGYRIYEDLNVIITPLFYYIGRLIFFIFGNNFMSFRIYNIMIFSTLFTTIYILFKKIEIEKINAFTYTLIMFFILKDIIVAGANYNVLVMIFVIIGIILQFNKKSKKNDILNGIIIFCIFLTKQNVFVYYCIALFFVNLIRIKTEKIKIKEEIKSLSIIAITFLIPLIEFFVYLKISNQLEHFISYCLLGLSEFGANNKIIGIPSIPFIVTSIIGIFISIFILRLKNANEKIKKINLYTIPFQINMLFLSFPIINKYHTALATSVSILVLIYNLHNIFLVEFINKNTVNKIMKISATIITLYFLCFNSYIFFGYKNSKSINYNLEPYDGILIDKDLKTKINTICEYVKENENNNIETKIISVEANLYINVLQKNNKNMDLPMLGNFGKNGEDGLISEVQNLKQGTRILLSKEKFWQESDKLRNMIMNEYEKIGEIEDFYIYEK